MTMRNKLSVALVQATPRLFDLEASLEVVADWTAQAAARGARLVLFPEAFLPAYPRGLSFGTVVGSRSPEGREDWLLYYSNALTVPGPATEQLAAIAAEHKVWLVIGVTERSLKGGTLYCTLLYFSPQGELVQKHRKLKPTGSERILWGEGVGDDLQVVPTPFGSLGGLICWENYMPLARMTLYEQGINIYVAPTADHRDSWLATMIHIACEGRCFVLACNQFVRKQDYPKRFQKELKNQPDIMTRGGTVIISPLGKIVAGPMYGQEGIVEAELDLDLIPKSNMDFDAAGHYNRPDVFSYSWLKNPKNKMV
ncbi:MAG: carbon-nitrogen hydrolase family protein [Saprospiraceae bacterium]|nr:carbon-nitrogen hydrolase family protein [Saprospiraceae bacterium]